MKLNARVEYLLLEVNQPKLSELEIKDGSYNLVLNNNSGYAGYIIINKTDNSHIWSPHFYKTLGFIPNEIMPSHESLENIIHPCDFVILEKISQDFKRLSSNALMVKVRYKTKYSTYKQLNTRVKFICQDTSGIKSTWV